MDGFEALLTTMYGECAPIMLADFQTPSGRKQFNVTLSALAVDHYRFISLLLVAPEVTNKQAAIILGVRPQNMSRLRSAAIDWFKSALGYRPVLDPFARLTIAVGSASFITLEKYAELAKLANLGKRTTELLDFRFGLTDNFMHMLEETGRRFKITRERVRAIESKAFRLLKHAEQS